MLLWSLMSNINSQEIVEALAYFDSHYAQRWAYESFADEIDLQREDIHLDIGCGLGPILLELYHKNPQAVLLGTDCNWTILANCARNLEAAGVPTQFHHQIGLRPWNGEINLEFVPDMQHLQRINPIEAKGKVTLFSDDIKEARVLRAILGKRKIQSCSFTFPGVSERALHEKRVDAQKKSADEIRRKIMAIMADTRQAAYKTATAIVEPDGELLLAERMTPLLSDHEGAGVEDTARIIYEQIGALLKYWEVEKLIELGTFLRLDGSPAGIARDPDGHVISTPCLTGVGMKLRRNRKNFEVR